MACRKAPEKVGRNLAISRPLAPGLAAIALLFAESVIPVQAQPCIAHCGSRQIQFTPGQRIQVQMVNRTRSILQVERILQTDAVPLIPNQTLQLDPSFGTQPNISVVFWDETQLPVRAVLFRPQPNTLRIELFPASQPPGDRSVYIENDGKVAIF
ncbi:MAG TPA: hypothetical protein V6C57_13355 [Coleofasciculaceae cyanobacterium]